MKTSKSKVREKGETLTLKPKDYIIFNGGLKIENVSEENVIEVELPHKYTVYPLEITRIPTPNP